MNEQLLYFIWEQKLFLPFAQHTMQGEPVEVINTGQRNSDAGPDYFNAKVRVADTLWAGNVEMHVRASDWYTHQHHKDKAYDSVILHVVCEADCEIFRSNGEQIPQCELQFSKVMEQTYQAWLQAKGSVPCAHAIRRIPTPLLSIWKTALLTERLAQKTAQISLLLEKNNYHWEEAFYVTLARNFGFHTNAQAFEQLAKSLPLHCLTKHKEHLFQLEALLFGQSGLLDEVGESYSQKLLAEYRFLAAKFHLVPMAKERWRLLRLRPSNFPHIRIAQLAALIHRSHRLLSQLVDDSTVESLTHLFRVTPGDYWKTHYTFGKESECKDKRLGDNAIQLILINTVIPFLFSYGELHQKEELKERAFELLYQLKPERNAVVDRWRVNGLIVESAADSQAIIQLQRHYCDVKRCLHCRIGHKVLTQCVSKTEESV